MPRHVWTVICRRATIDSETNSVSIFEVVEEMHVKGVSPSEKVLVPRELELISLWARSDVGRPEVGHTRLRMLTPKDETTGVAEGEIDLRGHRRLRFRLKLGTMALDGPGVYEFAIDLREGGGDWREVTRIPLDVVFETDLPTPAA